MSCMSGAVADGDAKGSVGSVAERGAACADVLVLGAVGTEAEVLGGMGLVKVVIAGSVHDSSSWAVFVAGTEDEGTSGAEAVVVDCWVSSLVVVAGKFSAFASFVPCSAFGSCLTSCIDFS